MEIRVKNGITIISTGVYDTKNKYKVKGVHFRDSIQKYVLELNHNGKKVHIGNYETLEEAKKIREIMDKEIEEGTIDEWVTEWKKDRSRKNKYGVAGLSKKKNRYQLNVKLNSKNYYVGSFPDIESAAEVRREIDKEIDAGTFKKWYEEYRNK